MLFGNETISQYNKSNVSIWMLMAFQAGLINTGAFLATHRFVSHVTGFATFFGIELGHLNYSGAMGMLVVPIFFLIGSMLSGFLIDIRLKQKKKPLYFLSFGIMFLFTSAALVLGQIGYFGSFGHVLDIRKDYLLLAILCTVCGIQNGTITTVSKSIVRTTHLTGITTDLGIGIMRVINLRKQTSTIQEEVKANLMRVGLIFFFGLGSAAGSLVFMRHGYLGFILPALTSGLIFLGMFYFQVLRPNRFKS